jgi:CelD/BcsL family acetyltransferase involved in cellulose biosynthesis
MGACFMDYTVTEEGFDWFADCWRDGCHDLAWDTFFVLPPWLQVWRQAFAPDDRTSFFVVRQGDEVIGVAPLLIRDGTASIIGSPDVCDYADVVVSPGREAAFCEALLEHLGGRDITSLDLRSLRPDSAALSWLAKAAEQVGCRVTCEEDDVSLERDLPETWEEYLAFLSAKQRHEVRRKMRRWDEAGDVRYRFVGDDESLDGFLDTFLTMFVESRDDKAEFLTPEMEAFFRAMSHSLSRAGLLRAGLLELDGDPVAAIIGFDHNGIAYLYNSAFDPAYRSLSVGVISKVLYIKDSIERGMRRFDFLKGDERYKYHLGGQEVQLRRCRIDIV